MYSPHSRSRYSILQELVGTANISRLPILLSRILSLSLIDVLVILACDFRLATPFCYYNLPCCCQQRGVQTVLLHSILYVHNSSDKRLIPHPTHVTSKRTLCGFRSSPKNTLCQSILKGTGKRDFLLPFLH